MIDFSKKGYFNRLLAPLAPGISYSARAYATNANGTGYSGVTTFSSLGASPTLITTYTQNFANYDGTNPAGWTAISSGNFQAFRGDWNTGSAGGFYGNVTDPGVLGYQHTSDTLELAVTLRLVNGTGSPLTNLNVGYTGRVGRVTQGRIPQWAVSVNGSPANPALAYSTESGVDTAVSTTVDGLNIAPGAEFTIVWSSTRGDGPSGSASRQIGITGINISTGLAPPPGYDSWAATNVNGQASNLDFDGDGIDNGTEYFMGTAGNAFTANPGVVAGKVTWPRAAGTTIGSFKVEISETMSTWQDATVNYAANLSITAGQVVFTMPSTPTKLFVRLSVTP